MRDEKDTPIKRIGKKMVKTEALQGQKGKQNSEKNGNISMKVNYKRYTICNVLRWQIDLIDRNGSFQKAIWLHGKRAIENW